MNQQIKQELDELIIKISEEVISKDVNHHLKESVTLIEDIVPRLQTTAENLQTIVEDKTDKQPEVLADIAVRVTEIQTSLTEHLLLITDYNEDHEAGLKDLHTRAVQIMSRLNEVISEISDTVESAHMTTYELLKEELATKYQHVDRKYEDMLSRSRVNRVLLYINIALSAFVLFQLL
jgi:hypothetical protein